MKFSTVEAAAITNGRIHGPEVAFDGASQDSRAIETGQLFVPIVAERDGHEFISNALEAGAAAYLTHQTPTVGSAVVVDDTMRALETLARAARDRIDGSVIAITGSVGKTSTKDLLASVLREVRRTHASERSFNNEIGVPLTLLNTPDAAEAVVIEMGARGVGHVASLCEIARPDVGIVTTVAPAHRGEFGSVEAIAVAKGEIIETLDGSGLAVLNGDNPLVSGMAERTVAEVMTFGTTSACDVAVTGVDVDDELRATFTIDSGWGRVIARPSTRGAHMATNVAAAVGTALWLGVPIEDVEAGLVEAPLSPWRMEVHHTTTGALIINDSYNANPTSMLGAIESLAHLRHSRKVAIVGYMGELGEGEDDDHRRIAERISEIGAELIAVGTELYGVRPVRDADAAVQAVGSVDAETAVLVKGSRSAGLEVVAARLYEA